MTIRLYIKDLSPIGVMVQSKVKSTGSKQLSDRCTGGRALNYLENEWSSPVKDRLSPKLTKNQIISDYSLRYSLGASQTCLENK